MRKIVWSISLLGVCVVSIILVSSLLASDSWSTKLLGKGGAFLERVGGQAGNVTDGNAGLKEGEIEGTRLHLSDTDIAMMIPKECGGVTIYGVGHYTTVMLEHRSQPMRVMVVLDPKKKGFRHTFEMAYKRMARILGPKETIELSRYMSSFVAMSEEKQFLGCLSQTRTGLESAGTNNKKAFMAYMGLYFRIDLASKYKRLGIGPNRAYLGKSVSKPRSHSTIWVFDENGAILCWMEVPTTIVDLGLQIGSSVERSPRRWSATRAASIPTTSTNASTTAPTGK